MQNWVLHSLSKAVFEESLSDPAVKYLAHPARVAGDGSFAIVLARMSHAATATTLVYDQERIVGVTTLSDLLERLLGVGAR